VGKISNIFGRASAAVPQRDYGGQVGLWAQGVRAVKSAEKWTE